MNENTIHVLNVEKFAYFFATLRKSIFTENIECDDYNAYIFNYIS
jgi:hypothetical protein